MGVCVDEAFAWAFPWGGGGGGLLAEEMLCKEFVVGFCSGERGWDVVGCLLWCLACWGVFLQWSVGDACSEGRERIGDRCGKGREGGLNG